MLTLLIPLLLSSTNLDLERTLDVIEMVESSGGKDKRDGDSGKARGSFQIHRNYWLDGTKALGVKWPYSDARDPAKARRVVRAYLMRYEPHGSPETWCRLHNSGPNWSSKTRKTDAYWQRIKKHLN